MMSGLMFMSVSGAVLLILVSLFSVEEKKQRRIVLSGFRNWLDSVFEAIDGYSDRFLKFVGITMIRVTYHYIIHSLLSLMIRLLHRGQERLAHLQVRNRSIVKAVKKTTAATHLDQLSVFKKENSLTEAERKKLNKH